MRLVVSSPYLNAVCVKPPWLSVVIRFTRIPCGES